MLVAQWEGGHMELRRTPWWADFIFEGPNLTKIWREESVAKIMAGSSGRRFDGDGDGDGEVVGDDDRRAPRLQPT